MWSMPIDGRAVRDEPDEGGEAACWAHLLDDDGNLDPTTPDTDNARCQDGARAALSS